MKADCDSSTASGVQRLRLQDAAELVRGVTYKPTDLRSADAIDGVPLLRATNIQNDRLITDEALYVDQERVSPRQMLQQWDVLVAMSSGSRLAVGKLAQLLDPWSGTFGAFCGVLRPKIEIVDPAYFGFLLRTEAFRERIELMAQGTNIKNLAKEHLLGFTFDLPQLEEQRRIALASVHNSAGPGCPCQGRSPGQAAEELPPRTFFRAG